MFDEDDHNANQGRGPHPDQLTFEDWVYLIIVVAFIVAAGITIDAIWSTP